MSSALSPFIVSTTTITEHLKNAGFYADSDDVHDTGRALGVRVGSYVTLEWTTAPGMDTTVFWVGKVLRKETTPILFQRSGPLYWFVTVYHVLFKPNKHFNRQEELRLVFLDKTGTTEDPFVGRVYVVEDKYCLSWWDSTEDEIDKWNETTEVLAAPRFYLPIKQQKAGPRIMHASNAPYVKFVDNAIENRKPLKKRKLIPL